MKGIYFLQSTLGRLIKVISVFSLYFFFILVVEEFAMKIIKTEWSCEVDLSVRAFVNGVTIGLNH